MRALITDWRRMVYVYNQMIGRATRALSSCKAAIAGGDNFAVLKRALAGLNPSFRVIAASEAERWRCELFFSEMWAEVERVERKGEINDVFRTYPGPVAAGGAAGAAENCRKNNRRVPRSRAPARATDGEKGPGGDACDMGRCGARRRCVGLLDLSSSRVGWVFLHNQFERIDDWLTGYSSRFRTWQVYPRLWSIRA